MSEFIKRVTILGSGTSTGVPLVGCECEVCQSNDPKDHRSRASILLETIDDKTIIIDTGPEFRIQCVREKVLNLDAVLYTHLHADHCHGFDDLRGFYFKTRESLPCFLKPEFSLELQERFHYAFAETGYLGTGPKVDLIEIPASGTFEMLGHEVETLDLLHGNICTTGFRFGSFAYATDFKRFSDDQLARWKGKVHTMVASGIRWKPHGTHSSVEETVELFEKLEVKKGIITHLSHNISYLKDSARLPDGVSLAYDGMNIDLA